MFRKISILVSIAFTVVVLMIAVKSADARDVINIYTSRHYGVESVFEAFTKETGIMVSFIAGGDSDDAKIARATGRTSTAISKIMAQ